MVRKKIEKEPVKKELLHSRKILPEVEQRMIKGESIDILIRRKNFIYVYPKDGKEIDFEVLKEKLKKEYVREIKEKKLDLDKLLNKYKVEVDIKNIKKELEYRLKRSNIRGVKIGFVDDFISVTLPPEIIKEIAGEVEGIEGIKGISHIFFDRKSVMCLDKSSSTIKSTAARNVFGNNGEGIAWAVIDTGITIDNPYISNAVEGRFDFTGEGIGDRNGHGTHVAGIIASRSEKYPGIAPKARLYDFKVLDAGGRGSEFAVIQAMEKIRKINNESGKIVIHGANVSLGMSPQVGSYGVGSSPVCQVANRLVNSGVIVCVAASNDGFKTLAAFKDSTKVERFRTFMDLTISDPGNAEEVITVGSVHKSNPHTYGISYFSSKGPTGDGRYKPDVVAPGEKIRSLGLKSGEDGVEMSGTSMATPHVSGALALFLSTKKEFIGQPHKVKEILMKNCVDLERDRYFQGAGLIDVLKAIQAV